jgi:hypothetical protein
MGIKIWEVCLFSFFWQKMEEWTNLIGSYGFIHYIQVDDSMNIAQIAAERGSNVGFESISAFGCSTI